MLQDLVCSHICGNLAQQPQAWEDERVFGPQQPSNPDQTEITPARAISSRPLTTCRKGNVLLMWRILRDVESIEAEIDSLSPSCASVFLKKCSVVDVFTQDSNTRLYTRK